MVSKTQEKRAERKREAAEFVKVRRDIQVGIFERNFKAGLAMYESNKDKLTPEQIVDIEAQIEDNRALIEKLKHEADSLTQT